MAQQGDMEDIFRGAGISLTRIQSDRFYRLYELLAEYNEEWDLSRLRSFNDIVLKHFVDSVIFTRYRALPSPLVDIGTGPGFPGIPLKIMNPDLHIILAEPRHMRVRFMELVRDKLKLEGIEIYPHLVTDKSFFTVNAVITRALEDMAGTMQRVRHFLPEGGEIFFLKGPDAGTDRESIPPEIAAEFQQVQDTEYVLPQLGHTRRLVVFRHTRSVLTRTYRIMINAEETPGLPITSPDNRRFKEFKRLASGDSIKKTCQTLVCGKKILKEVIREKPGDEDYLLVFDGYRETDTAAQCVLDRFREADRLLVLKKNLYNELDIFNTQDPLLVTSFNEVPDWDGTIDEGCTLVIPFQDPANVGTVIRTAAGFGVKHCVLLRESAHPFHPRSVRSSSGTVFRMSFSRGPSMGKLGEIAASKDIPLVTLDKNGQDIRGFSFPGSFLLLPGIEGPGLPADMKKGAVAIPLSADVESLNGAVAASVALYEWRRRFS